MCNLHTSQADTKENWTWESKGSETTNGMLSSPPWPAIRRSFAILASQVRCSIDSQKPRTSRGDNFFDMRLHGCCQALLSPFKCHEQQRTGMLGEAQTFVNNFDLPWLFHQHLPVPTIPRFQFLTKHWDFRTWFEPIVVHVWPAVEAFEGARRQLRQRDEIEWGAEILCTSGGKPPSCFCRARLSLQRPFPWRYWWPFLPNGTIHWQISWTTNHGRF